MQIQINRKLDTNVGTKFLSISNESLAELVMAVSNGSGFKVHHSANGQKFFAHIDLRKYAENVPELGGDLIPRIYMRNSNMGDSSFQVGVGLFRLICSNGLAVGLGDSFTARIRHLDGPKANQLLDILPDILMEQILRIQSGEMIEKALDALETRVNDPIAVVGNLPVSKTTKDAVVYQIVTNRYRHEDTPTNAWGLYNMVNEDIRRRSKNGFIAIDKDVGLLDDVMLLAA